jgi:CheY-like chemotaxis protein
MRQRCDRGRPSISGSRRPRIRERRDYPTFRTLWRRDFEISIPECPKIQGLPEMELVNPVLRAQTARLICHRETSMRKLPLMKRRFVAATTEFVGLERLRTHAPPKNLKLGEAKLRNVGTTMANILIVEDDVALRDTVRDLLTAWHYDVAVVGKGAQALEFLRTTRARTVVLLDVRLPDSTGLDVLRRVVADPSITAQLTFVLMTAYPQLVPPLTGVEGADLLRVSVPVVAKPFKYAVLLAQIEKAARALA